MFTRRYTRWIAGLMVVALLTAACCPALAQSVAIPADAKRIGESAFEGDTSLDEVVLPEGIERIEARAFADSSLNAINLPRSLEFIAEDAFQGADVTAAVYGDSYAYAYVTDNGISYTLLDRMESVLNIVYNEEFEPYLSVEGLNDVDIPEIDAQIQAIRDEVDSYNALCGDILSVLDEIELSVGDDNVYFSVSSPYFSYSISADVYELLSSIYSVGDFVSLGDNVLQIEVWANGERHYVIQTLEGISLSGARGVDASRGMAVWDGWESAMDKIAGLSELFDNLGDAILSIDLASRTLIQYLSTYETYISNIAEELERWKSFCDKLEAIKLIDDLLAIPSKCRQVTDADRMRKDLEDILSHGHPTYQENLFSYSRDIAAIVNSKANAAIVTLWSEMFKGYYDAYTAAASFKNFVRKTPTKPMGKWDKVIDDTPFSQWLGSAYNAGEAGFFQLVYNKAHQLHDEAVAYDEELHYDANIVVKDKEGAQVSGAEILCDDVTFYTNEYGLCGIEVPYSSNVLQIKKGGYKGVVESVSCEPFIPKMVPVVLEKLMVHGHVYDVKTKEPLTGALVSTGEATVQTDENGYYKMVLEEEGQYTLTFSMDNYAEETETVTVDGTEEVDENLRPTTGKVSGYVRDPETNAGVKDVKVTVEGVGFTWTYSDGYYEFTLPVGSYAMKFEHRNYRKKNDSVSISGGDDIIKNEVLSTGPKGSVYGRVFAWSDTEPLAGCKITNGEITVYSDADGFYAINLPEGDHTLYFSYDEWDYYVWNEVYDVSITGSEQYQLDVNFDMGFADI